MFFLLFLVAFILVLGGASGVIRGASRIARKIHISPLIIGITAVAIGTSLPEITVSFFGGVENAGQLALGNIIGSNIANIGLILAVSVLFGGIHVGRYKTQSNVLLYFFLSIITFTILSTGSLTILSGTIFIVSGFIALWWQIHQGKNGALVEDKTLFEGIKNDNSNPVVLSLLFIISLCSLIIGGKLLVDYGILIATYFNLSQTVIGVSIVAIGTSLPELAVSVIGILKKEEKLVIGNILGSNIFNILFGAGILGIYNVGGLASGAIILTFVILSLFFSLVLYVFRGKQIPRYLGGMGLIIYLGYLLLIFTEKGV